MPFRPLSFLRRALRSGRGSVSVETMLILPLVIWSYLATYEYFDVFGKVTNNLRATYTIADLLSRQTGTVTPTYIDGLTTLYSFLDQYPPGVWTRVTCVSWDPNAGSNGLYYVMWSYATNNHTALVDSTLQTYVSRLPTIAQGDTLIMVETHMTYVPMIELYGVHTMPLDELVITRPRISPQVAFSST